RLRADVQGQPVNELVEQQVRAHHVGVEHGDQRRGQRGGEAGGQRFPLPSVGAEDLVDGAHRATGLHTSKKLNHWVGCSRTTSSRAPTQATAAASSSPRSTNIGLATCTR